MNKLLWIVVAVVVVAGGWYWWSMQSTPAPATPSTAMGTNGSPNQGNMGQPANGTPQQPSTDGPGSNQNLALGVSTDAKLGQYLTASNGMTVYTKSTDSAGKSTCTGTCAQNWPPYTVSAGAVLNLQAGITGAISTITRADGTVQVTYKGMPLYFYVKDAKPGDVTGEGFGGTWSVVKA